MRDIQASKLEAILKIPLVEILEYLFYNAGPHTRTTTGGIRINSI